MPARTKVCVIVVLMASTLSVSCSRGGGENPPSAAMPPATGTSQGLTRSDMPAKCFLDSIGPASHPAFEKSVRVPETRPIVFAGWAIDEPNKAVASGLDIVIDNIPYGANYGSSRTDVAEHFQNPSYRNSGFQLTMATGQMPKGSHSVVIRVISQDRKAYYQSLPAVFTVE